MLLQWKMRGRITVTQTRCSALQLTLGQQLSRLLPLGLVERETGMAFSKSSLSNSNPALHFLQPQHLTPCAKSLGAGSSDGVGTSYTRANMSVPVSGVEFGKKLILTPIPM